MTEMKSGKLANQSLTLDDNGVIVYGDVSVWIDDSDLADIKAYSKPHPETEMGSTHHMLQEMRTVLSDDNDTLLAKVKGLEDTIAKKDEIIVELSGQLKTSNDRVMVMFDHVLEKVEGKKSGE